MTFLRTLEIHGCRSRSFCQPTAEGRCLRWSRQDRGSIRTRRPSPKGSGSGSNLTDAFAEKLATQTLDLEARRQALEAWYFDRLKTALSPRTALRLLQVEHQLLLVIDLKISAALPIAR